MYCRRLAVGALLFLAFAGSPAGIGAAQDDDIAKGRMVAVRACGGCHAVTANQSEAMADGVPALPIAIRRESIDAAWLRNFLGAPHQRMPSMALVRDDREALIAYLLSLKRP